MSGSDLSTPMARVAADLLRAGRAFFLLSLVLSGCAALTLLMGAPGTPVAGFRLLLVAVLVFGLGACWFAFRIGFDAAIFARFGREAGEGGIAPEAIDAALASAGLARSLPEPRPMQARLRGAVRLLVAQLVCLIAQVICILGFAAFPWLRLP
ncbi:hypothetical protein GCM10007301_18490 [Azorhizobium oxalatiphilum]|uniref:Transmembrane protein n=1 Tax=Azorhizobium oxalatiphilum TaxID=980631 RepID=A0A917F9U3_9HYPH|nr:hypothetical protein [Azorhizobium oxalatiphilum]GGF59088.1 hypothetical protein GCM10007301_18490 [Azorhizobium oxalatiphilum]